MEKDKRRNKTLHIDRAWKKMRGMLEYSLSWNDQKLQYKIFEWKYLISYR